MSRPGCAVSVGFFVYCTLITSCSLSREQGASAAAETWPDWRTEKAVVDANVFDPITFSLKLHL